MTSLSFILPVAFDPAEFLTASTLRDRLDDARYFMHLLMWKLSRLDVDKLGVVRLMAGKLSPIMYQPTSRAVRDALREGGAVQRFNYVKGVKSFGFLPAERYAAVRHARVPVSDERLKRQWQGWLDEQGREQIDRMKPVHHTLAMLQKRLRIHGDEARRILERVLVQFPKANRFDRQGILIRDIEDGVFHLSVGEFGRVFNNITSLKREVRQALRVEGAPLGNVDVRCCQPALISKLIQQQTNLAQKREGKEREGATSNYDSSRETPNLYDSSLTNRDVGHYKALVQSGEFYDSLVNEISLRGASITRDALKKKFLQDVIAKEGRYQSVVEDVFRELFPTVHRFIREVNRNGKQHANLIRQLQREESLLVIETVMPDLLRRHPGVFFTTLHDGVYSTAEHLPKVEQAFHRAFDQTGFTMSLKVEQPKDSGTSPKTIAQRPDPVIRIAATATSSPIGEAGPPRELEWVSVGVGMRWPRLPQMDVAA